LTTTKKKRATTTPVLSELLFWMWRSVRAKWREN